MKIYAMLDGTKINGLYNEKFWDTMVELNLTNDEYTYLIENALAAHYIGDKVVYKDLEKFKLKIALEKEQADILQWFADTDWKVNKFVIGEWDKVNPKWVDYVTERQAKRARLDEIEELL